MKVAYAGESQMIVEDALSRYNSILEFKPLVEPNQTLPIQDASIEISHVDFGYESGKKKAIDDLSLSIAPGRHIALVGPSAGTIKVGKMKVQDIDPEKLLSLYSIVFQDVTLFNNTVMENIRIGKKDAPIILMDEATASLDVDDESMIQESISKLIANKTVLIIAHRMRSVEGCDKVVVLKDGKVVQFGKPKLLKNEEGIYKHRVEVQHQINSWKYE